MGILQCTLAIWVSKHPLLHERGIPSHSRHEPVFSIYSQEQSCFNRILKRSLRHRIAIGLQRDCRKEKECLGALRSIKTRLTHRTPPLIPLKVNPAISLRRRISSSKSPIPIGIPVGVAILYHLIYHTKQAAVMDFPKEEEKILARWKEIDAFQQSLRLNADKPTFRFYDGRNARTLPTQLPE